MEHTKTLNAFICRFMYSLGTDIYLSAEYRLFAQSSALPHPYLKSEVNVEPDVCCLETGTNDQIIVSVKAT